jgi:nucleotide-binding universal stress UspA family protein
MNLQTILVPLDGSELAERALLPAVTLAAGMGAKLTLLTVISSAIWKDASRPIEAAVQSHKYEAGLYLKGVRSRLLPTTVEIETAVIPGNPPSAIIQYARQNDVGLIMLSSHGRSGLNRWSFGRVAEKVLRRAPCPTLILRSEPDAEPPQFKRILVPLDGSSLAEKVLPPTRLIATAARAELVLLHVVEPTLLPFANDDAGRSEKETQEGLAYLTVVQDSMAAAGLPVRTELRSGPAAETILDYAAEQSVDLIVLSSLGSSGFQMWAFGGVAERVMKGATCATLVLRHESG